MAGEQAPGPSLQLHRLTLVLTGLPAGSVFNFQIEQTPRSGRIDMSDLQMIKLSPASPGFALRYFSLSAGGVFLMVDRSVDLLTLSLQCTGGGGVLRGHLELTEPGRVVIMTETDTQRLFGTSVWMVQTSSFAATGPPPR